MSFSNKIRHYELKHSLLYEKRLWFIELFIPFLSTLKIQKFL